MSKKKKPSPEHVRLTRIAEIESSLLSLDLKKKQRAALRSELADLTAQGGTFTPPETLPPVEAAVPFAPAEATALVEDEEQRAARLAKQEAEVAAQWAHQKSLVSTWSEDTEPGPEATSGKDVPTPPVPTFDSIKEFVDGLKPIGMDDLIEIGKRTIEPALKEALGLEAPADPVLENGNGQAIIHFVDPATGKEKAKGYTRVTTYIDGLDDKTVLTKWKMRTLLEGAAVEERDLLKTESDTTTVSQVGRALTRLDAAIADIDSREREEGELLELRRQELLKEHRTFVESRAEWLMELGGAHEKAIKGTNLHRLTELVDTGHDLPADTTASDRRDVEAYTAKMQELGIETLWTERRVVLDDIQVSGTMDRAYRVKLPGAQRRTRVVGDLKTGSVDWGRGKIACQLALYARGLGYDWAKPLERERLSLSKVYGLLVHLPQGEGRCEVYVVDLELASKGLDLARQVREWRRDQRRAYDLTKPMVGQE